MDVYQRRRLIALSSLAALFIVAVLLIRSCGDGDETAATPAATTTPTELTSADYISQADAICLEANTSLASVDDSDPTEAATAEGQILAGELESLQTLTPPADATAELDAFFGALEEQVSAYDSFALALERGDDSAAELEATIDQASADAEQAGRRFGFEVCGDTSQVEETAGNGGDGGGDGATTEPTEPAPTDPTAPVAPVEPAPTEPAPAPAPAPTDDTGGATPAPEPAPEPAPTDGGDSGSGGITP